MAKLLGETTACLSAAWAPGAGLPSQPVVPYPGVADATVTNDHTTALPTRQLASALAPWERRRLARLQSATVTAPLAVTLAAAALKNEAQAAFTVRL